MTSGTAGTTYSAVSGTTNVISVSPDGIIEARGPGEDIVVVTNGGLSQQVTVAATITNHSPILSAINDVTVQVGASVTINLSASDPDGDPLKFYDANFPLFASFRDFGDGTGELTLQPRLSDVGTHSAAVAVLDNGDPQGEAGRSFVITVPAAPAITLQPVNQRANAGQNTQFTVAATGTPTPTYQWQVRTNGGASWQNLVDGAPYDGVTASTLAITSVPLGLNGNQYQCVVTNSAGSTTTLAATLAVIAPAPAITLQPVNQRATTGQNTQFTVAATGTPTPTYQWQVSTNGGASWQNLVDGAPYAGVTASTLAITNVAPGLNGNQYQCVATNSVGSATTLAARLAVSAPGSGPSHLDQGFGAGGRVTTSFVAGETAQATALAVQPDGKIVVVGHTGRPPNPSRTRFETTPSDFAVARYNADGTLDTTFGIGGKVVTDFFGDEDRANAVALQPDGKIVVAGYETGQSFYKYGDVSFNASGYFHGFALVRYLPNGQLDTTFGIGGKVTTITRAVVKAKGLTIQPDGRIVAVGDAFDGDFNDWNIALVRYNVDGSLDSAGVNVISLWGDDEASSVALLPDGKVIVGGTTGDFALLRFQSNGLLDPTFGSGGYTTTDTSDLSYQRLNAIALQADGRIISAGWSLVWNYLDHGNSIGAFSLSRHKADGTLDDTFGYGGIFKSHTSPELAGSGVAGVVVDTAGRVVAAGSTLTTPSASSDFLIARFTRSGALDGVFGGTGHVTTDFFGRDDHAHAVALQPDGHIVVVGSATVSDGTDVFAIARYEGGGACTYTSSLWFTSYPAIGGLGYADVTAPVGCDWTATSDAPWMAMTVGSGSGTGLARFTVAANSGPTARIGIMTIAGRTFTVTQGAAPSVALDRAFLNFSAVTTGASFVSQTGAQQLRLTQIGSGTASWTATSNSPWLTVTPPSGTGSRVLTVSVQFVPGVSATTSGSITFAFTGAANVLAPVSVRLNVVQNGTSGAPFGVVETPLNNSTGVTGSLAVTGWAHRRRRGHGGADSSRPGRRRSAGGAAVSSATPCSWTERVRTSPSPIRISRATPRAGWGYMLLTNFLPNQGNGTFRAPCVSPTTRRARRRCSARAPSPAPTRVATHPLRRDRHAAQGRDRQRQRYNNFGWVLVPGTAACRPARRRVGERRHRRRGRRGAVRMDVPSGHLGAVSSPSVSRRELDARRVHVRPVDADRRHAHHRVGRDGRPRGTRRASGSRYFTVANGSVPLADGRRGRWLSARTLPASARPRHWPRRAMTGRRGFNLAAPYARVDLGADGRATLAGRGTRSRSSCSVGGEGDPSVTGHLTDRQRLGPLPIGSHLDAATGVFTWQPGVGFVGAYDLVFVRWIGRPCP